jgi:hypothetical protein
MCTNASGWLVVSLVSLAANNFRGAAPDLRDAVLILRGATRNFLDAARNFLGAALDFRGAAFLNDRTIFRIEPSPRLKAKAETGRRALVRMARRAPVPSVPRRQRRRLNPGDELMLAA